MPKDMNNVAIDWIEEPMLIVIAITGIIVISYFISVIGYARKKWYGIVKFQSYGEIESNWRFEFD